MNTENTKTCPNCGSINKQNNEFCNQCGFSLIKEPPRPVKKKHIKKWLFFLVGGLLTIIVGTAITLSTVCFHDWKPATCTSPVTCMKCDATDGNTLEHNWIDATCTTAKICKDCGKTEGEPVEHDWIPATCTTAKTCKDCDGTEGKPVEHTWIDATCSNPKTCSVCKLQEGSCLEHNYSEWEIIDKATISTPGTKQRICSTCQNIDSESYKLESFVENGKFIFTPKEFSDMFFDKSVTLGCSQFGGASTKNKDGQVMVDIRDNTYNNIGNIGFVANKNAWIMASSETESGFDGLTMMISTSDELVANSMIAMIMSCDPTVSEINARLTAAEALKETTTHNGIEYSTKKTGNMYTMTAVPTV
ncbi:MAG: zinc ribbon domain-containing protein [Acutalibacteraceae bacterium]|nr:zinc ribbon domain-containing protein [Acutalibacteraceae bacterium]